MGLPTPNLSSAQHNIHSLNEWTSVEEMEKVTEVLLHLAAIWTEAPGLETIREAPLDEG